MMSNTYRIAQIFAYRDGWTNEDGTWTRAGVETGDVEGAVMLAARRGPNLGARADLVDFVFVADGKGIWGVGRKVAVSAKTHPRGERNARRCFIVDPYDVPADVLAMVGSPRPSSARANVQYGLLADGEFLMDSDVR